MAPVTALLFCHRLSTIDAAQMRTYCEEKHVPLVKSLLRDKYPSSHMRYYTNKDAGFQIGSPSSTDADLIAVITYDSPDAMQESMKARQADGTRELIEADEAKFMDRSKIQLKVLGEHDVGISSKD